MRKRLFVAVVLASCGETPCDPFEAPVLLAASEVTGDCGIMLEGNAFEDQWACHHAEQMLDRDCLDAEGNPPENYTLRCADGDMTFVAKVDTGQATAVVSIVNGGQTVCEGIYNLIFE